MRPARAPPSIDMLQTVIRPSIGERSGSPSPAYSMTWPVPPAVPISPMMARMMSLAVTPGGGVPSTVMRMFFAFFWISVWVASTCSTSEVPMPWASAPKAPWVEVWLSPQTMVMPGRVKPCSGPTMWTMPCRWSSSSKYSTPNSAAFFARAATWVADSSLAMPLRAVGGRHVVVDDGERLLRGAHLAAGEAQALEGLRAGHLMDEVAVDIEEAGAVLGLMDDMVVPDLVVEGFGLAHDACSGICLASGRRPVSGCYGDPAECGRRRFRPALGGRGKPVDGDVPGEKAPRQPRPVVQGDDGAARRSERKSLISWRAR